MLVAAAAAAARWHDAVLCASGSGEFRERVGVTIMLLRSQPLQANDGRTSRCIENKLTTSQAGSFVSVSSGDLADIQQFIIGHTLLLIIKKTRNRRI